MISGRPRERKFLLQWLQKRNDYLVTRGTRPISPPARPGAAMPHPRRQVIEQSLSPGIRDP
jgi:hypothetical protein